MIFGHNTVVVRALAHETQTIPIVFVVVTDPIGSGFATSLAHPGGNITGFTDNDPVVGGKWLGLLKEIAPRTNHVGLLFNPATAAPLRFFMPAVHLAATSLAIEMSDAPVHATDEIETIIAAQARDPGGGLVVMPDPFSTRNSDMIAALALRYGVPAIYSNVSFAKSGGLIAYGTDRVEQSRLAAEYIDRILRGAKPNELPIQLPGKYNLAINLKTAKTFNLSVPQTLLATADEVIE